MTMLQLLAGQLTKCKCWLTGDGNQPSPVYAHILPFLILHYLPAHFVDLLQYLFIDKSDICWLFIWKWLMWRDSILFYLTCSGNHWQISLFSLNLYDLSLRPVDRWYRVIPVHYCDLPQIRRCGISSLMLMEILVPSFTGRLLCEMLCAVKRKCTAVTSAWPVLHYSNAISNHSYITLYLFCDTFKRREIPVVWYRSIWKSYSYNDSAWRSREAVDIMIPFTSSWLFLREAISVYDDRNGYVINTAKSNGSNSSNRSG
jgi:hypothetical protein